MCFEGKSEPLRGRKPRMPLRRRGVSIEVHGTGVGIGADEMHRIFDLFLSVGSRSVWIVGLFVVSSVRLRLCIMFRIN